MYIKHLELTRFKSFGQTTGIPLLPGFTVISGPNGSGKSNLLDALLFALGLSTSKGMRAERLPDLVNQAHLQKGRTAEAQVKVTFATPEGDWTVTRKLRVTQQGTYTSTYCINDTPCTLTELHEALSKFHIYPEGYNIVLQGDITSIISMNGKDRRAIIDELAGVGDFDRKINAAKEKLDEVKLQEEKYRLIEQELITTQEKLKHDRAKALEYQQLRQELAEMELWQIVLNYQKIEQEINERTAQQAKIGAELGELQVQLAELTQSIAQKNLELEALQQQVQALGESEFLAISQAIAEQQAELKNLDRQHQTIDRNLAVNQEQMEHLQRESDRLTYQINTWTAQLAEAEILIQQLRNEYTNQQAELAKKQAELEALGVLASQYLQQHSQLFHQIANLQTQLEPKKQELTRLTESIRQWQEQLTICTQELAQLPDPEPLQQQLLQQQQEIKYWEQQIQQLAEKLSTAQANKQLHQDTSDRLWQEQRTKQRQLDKLEAQQQASREIQGTRATQLILNSNLQGVYGLTAQLAKVQPEHQLALEIAAGNRLAFIVVEDDLIASQGIELLKQERAGRATFLPLNKLKKFFPPSPQSAKSMGAIDYAVNLLEYDPKFTDVFGFVFGNTLVFPTLNSARPYLGQQRMVTLEGELLETTGAMSGGSMSQRDGIHFGKITNPTQNEIDTLQARVAEIDLILRRLQIEMQSLQSEISHYEQQLLLAREKYNQAQRNHDRSQTELSTLVQVRHKLITQRQKLDQSITLANAQQESISAIVQDLEHQLTHTKEQLHNLEASTTHSEWQNLQKSTTEYQQILHSLAQSLHQQEQQQQQLEHLRQLAQSQIQQIQTQWQSLHHDREHLLNELTHCHRQKATFQQQLLSLEQAKTELQARLGTVKTQRDQCDRTLRTLYHQQQDIVWQIEKLQQRIRDLEQEISQLHTQRSSLQLPDLLPALPEGLSLNKLQAQQQQLQQKLQALEPVNMLAIAEYDGVTRRLDELSHKLSTLVSERSELLLRIENFTTLRQNAFMTAFNAVNENFQKIFAELSDGDGYLQLENPHDPLSAGLNLVAHPKGKPVQNLSSMSGGEKSLTALSFIFALQRYRPSPFYAFDEVDMFLDGANVERLARMVQKQAQLAQFIVVSLRRPMIDAADRTIGVTQARGAFTQVFGLERDRSA
ncbi:MAG: chromosome segregation protein SMC [Pseudanabaenaceae cyanobacterium]